jgi:hypothetical protein
LKATRKATMPDFAIDDDDRKLADRVRAARGEDEA